jgi:hypothetical protein
LARLISEDFRRVNALLQALEAWSKRAGVPAHGLDFRA